MNLQDKKAFSIIEVMIAIFVFAFGLTSVFAMLSGSINMSDYSRNLIVASHLADEQLEMFKNVRDSNYKKGQKWDIKNPADGFGTSTFEEDLIGDPGKGIIPCVGGICYYKLIYDDGSNGAEFPVKVEELVSFQVGDSLSEINYMNDNYRLCLTPEGQYTYDCTSTGNEETAYYRYLYIEKPSYSGGDIDNAYKVTSTVVWRSKKTHSTEISTVVADWKRY